MSRHACDATSVFHLIQIVNKQTKNTSAKKVKDSLLIYSIFVYSARSWVNKKSDLNDGSGAETAKTLKTLNSVRKAIEKWKSKVDKKKIKGSPKPGRKGKKSSRIQSKSVSTALSPDSRSRLISESSPSKTPMPARSRMISESKTSRSRLISESRPRQKLSKDEEQEVKKKINIKEGPGALSDYAEYVKAGITI